MKITFEEDLSKIREKQKKVQTQYNQLRYDFNVGFEKIDLTDRESDLKYKADHNDFKSNLNLEAITYRRKAAIKLEQIKSIVNQINELRLKKDMLVLDRTGLLEDYYRASLEAKSMKTYNIIELEEDLKNLHNINNRVKENIKKKKLELEIAALDHKENNLLAAMAITKNKGE